MDETLKLREIIRRASDENLDLKAYEADMRHLIDTYIEADEPRKISPFDGLSLLELIVKTGIADAINSLPSGLRNSREGVAETIENNVRSKIIKEHLNDPAYFDKMSHLLDEIIAARKARAIEYEEYLKRIADLARRVEAGLGDDTPSELNTPGRRALYNNLKREIAYGSGHGVDEDTHSYGDTTDQEALARAVRIDKLVKLRRPDGWRGVRSREQIVKGALYDELRDMAEVTRLFAIIVQHKEY